MLVELYGYQIASKNNQESSSWKYPIGEKSECILNMQHPQLDESFKAEFSS